MPWLLRKKAKEAENFMVGTARKIRNSVAVEKTQEKNSRYSYLRRKRNATIRRLVGKNVVFRGSRPDAEGSPELGAGGYMEEESLFEKLTRPPMKVNLFKVTPPRHSKGDLEEPKSPNFHLRSGRTLRTPVYSIAASCSSASVDGGACSPKRKSISLSGFPPKRFKLVLKSLDIPIE